MNIFSKFLALSMAIIAFSFVNVNAQGFSVEIPASVLEQRVEKKILGLPYYEVFDFISYDVDGSTVILAGKVFNGINKSSAEGAVKRIEGVTNVINNIEILPPGRFDDSIRRNVYRSMHNTGGLSRYLWPVNPSIRIIVDRGHITLEGYVSNQTDANLANIAASTTPGSFSVTNNLVVDKERAG
jgi:hypothetical protein